MNFTNFTVSFRSPDIASGRRRKNFKNSSAFTLMELLIVIALIALIAAGLLVLLNPLQQIAKSHDAKRKFELDALRRAFEEYYNDKGCYPLPEEVCYDTPVNICESTKTTTSRVCHICGLGPTPTAFPVFSPYMSQLPCDPQHAIKDYLYQVDVSCKRSDTCSSSNDCSTCPKWYRIYDNFSVKNDNDSNSLGCYVGGCGLPSPPPLFPQYGYDYGVSSPNVSLQATSGFVCFISISHACNICGTYQQCDNTPSCGKIYATGCLCCQDNDICESYPQCH